MPKYEEAIEESSLWVTATPSDAARTLPFYALEAGHFFAKEAYLVERDYHNSFLLIYTISGAGVVKTGDTMLTLSEKQAVIFDCRVPHKYQTSTEKWEFYWMHFDGGAASAMFGLLYPKNVRAFSIMKPNAAEHFFSGALTRMTSHAIEDCLDASAALHEIFNMLIKLDISDETEKIRKKHSADIDKVLDFIGTHYAEALTVEDMIREIPISKYHFIRVFRRILGVTPYSYLTDFRINRAKILLCTTEKTVGEIAAHCGYHDTSVFIEHFKKRVGTTPLGYRKDFS